MSTFKINPNGWGQVTQDIATLLEQVARLEVARLEDELHIDTGRLATTPRLEPTEIDGDSVTVSILVGGVDRAGVVREVGINRTVDYATVEEIRHPQVRGTIPEYAEDLREGFNL